MNDSRSTPPPRPLLVKLGLAGIGSRRAALRFVWFCLAVAALSVLLRFWLGLTLLISAAWYGYAIRWVDRHEGWKKPE